MEENQLDHNKVRLHWWTWSVTINTVKLWTQTSKSKVLIILTLLSRKEAWSNSWTNQTSLSSAPPSWKASLPNKVQDRKRANQEWTAPVATPVKSVSRAERRRAKRKKKVVTQSTPRSLRTSDIFWNQLKEVPRRLSCSIINLVLVTKHSKSKIEKDLRVIQVTGRVLKDSLDLYHNSHHNPKKKVNSLSKTC